MRKVDPVRHEQKRQEILQAALSCFVRDGFHGASTTDICAAAKISPGHLYHYFGSKEAIIEALVQHSLAHAASRFEAILASPDVIEAFLTELETTSIRRREAQVLSAEALAEACRNPSFARIVQDQGGCWWISLRRPSSAATSIPASIPKQPRTSWLRSSTARAHCRSAIPRLTSSRARTIFVS
jgi:AcrR family transcriptional regulator